MQAKAFWLSWGAVTLLGVGLAWDLARGPTTMDELDEAMAVASEAERQKLAMWWTRKRNDPKWRRLLRLIYTRGERERIRRG